jgi:pimeloyl-ACP methyl ester carboxylesterase
VPTLQLPDGRALAYETWGDPSGAPVLFAHGTGDSRLARHPDDAIAAGLRRLAARLPRCTAIAWPDGGHDQVFARWRDLLAPLAAAP